MTNFAGDDAMDDDDELADGDEGSDSGLLNLRLPTLGGKQFWTDHLWRNGWRIQQNAVTTHWRLLDPSNVRFAWGSRTACESVLAEHTAKPNRAETPYVVLLHGLFRSAASMQGLSDALATRFPWQTVLFEYASTRGSIGEHARAFREVVEGLPAGAPLRFVGHSMGNIVVRHALGDWEMADAQEVLKRLNSVVMLGPPNQGAAIARQLAKVPTYEWIAGEGGLELGPRWKEFEAHLATPSCPFGIVAGRLPDIVFNPLVGDVGDFVVSIEETRLAGGALLEVTQGHSFIMDDTTVQRAVGNFLDHHRFGD